MIKENNEPEAVELSLTDDAIEQIKRLLAQQKREGHSLRVAVADGGCSGYSYKLDFDTEPKPEDAVLERNGLKIFVDRASGPYLKGTVIDFVGGLYGGGFKFTNPNASGTCGCGTSFSA
jgi:iron-sulfur cluster assembly accessory protein